MGALIIRYHLLVTMIRLINPVEVSANFQLFGAFFSSISEEIKKATKRNPSQKRRRHHWQRRKAAKMSIEKITRLPCTLPGSILAVLLSHERHVRPCMSSFRLNIEPKGGHAYQYALNNILIRWLQMAYNFTT